MFSLRFANLQAAGRLYRSGAFLRGVCADFKKDEDLCLDRQMVTSATGPAGTSQWPALAEAALTGVAQHEYILRETNAPEGTSPYYGTAFINKSMSDKRSLLAAARPAGEPQGPGLAAEPGSASA